MINKGMKENGLKLGQRTGFILLQEMMVDKLYVTFMFLVLFDLT